MLTRFFKARKKKQAFSQAPSPKSVPSVDTGNHPLVPEWQPGDVINDRYRVDQIFSGAMGKVYIVDHLAWGIKMAIKAPLPQVLADKEGIKRVLAEANGWIKLGLHPNIAACYYVRIITNVPYLFIEYVDGGTLDEWIKIGRCRDFRTSLSLAVQFCNGMEYTHSKGIIHRDIKPQNILISKSGILKITDFGILRKIKSRESTDSADYQSTKFSPEDTIGFRGTPKYASPEQLRNTHNVDIRTDIFSFGICLWLMFCKKTPYEHNAEGGEPDPTPADPAIVLPDSLKEVLIKCVAYDPDKRYQNFSSLQNALNDVHRELFHVVCPYALMERVNLQAESYNNRAVSLVELGKFKKALILINNALEINDVLPEAIHNMIMLKWRKTTEKPERILGLIEATKKRLSHITLLDELEEEVRTFVNKGDEADPKKRNEYPYLLLCVPKQPKEIFRQSQLLQSIQQNVLELLKNKKIMDCHDVLMKSWRHNDFRKNNIFNRVYEQLLRNGKKVHTLAAQRVFTHPGQGSPARFLTYLGPYKKIITAGPDNRLVMHDLGSKKNVKIMAETGSDICSLSSPPSGNYFAAGLQDGSILLSSMQKKRHKVINTGKASVTSLAFSPDSLWLAAGTSEGELKIYNLKDGRIKIMSAPDGGAISSLIVLNSKLDVASGSEDGLIRLWMEGSGDYVRSIDAHVLPVDSLSATADGRLIASGSADQLVRVFDHLSGLCQHSIQAHDNTVTAVLIMPDGISLISGCTNDIIKVWNLTTGTCKLTLDSRGGSICSLNHGPQAHTFLAGQENGDVVLWMIIYQLDFS